MSDELCNLIGSIYMLFNDLLFNNNNNIYCRYVLYGILLMLLGIFITIIPTIFIYITNNQNLMIIKWIFFTLCSIITCPLGYFIFTTGFIQIITIIIRILDNKIINKFFKNLNLYFITDRLLLLVSIILLISIFIFSIYLYPNLIGFIIFILCFMSIVIFIYLSIIAILGLGYQAWTIYITLLIILIILFIILLIFLILITYLLNFLEKITF